ncbi:hypothetical protein HK099_002935 [Clydaea vesicula]|uniref:Uncharacterized protein n=1 Tax=Clydaea vesicula TaxID=447962 RepID=A0AAD5UAA2_9FUNG|nr:hypothetical protein HK099_002935 [Clydaea vesicula]
MELASVEEEYNVRLDTNLDLLVSNFSYLLRASTLTYEQVDKLGQEITVKKNKFNVKQEKLLIDGTTANIVIFL